MSDWYVSSAGWTALPQFAISTAYTVGQIIRSLAAPAAGAQHAFRCTTAGTSAATEPTWQSANNATTTSGGAIFTNVSGQSTYGWGGTAGSLLSLNNSASGGGRVAGGDRVFVSSDHSETNSNYQFGTAAGWTLIQVISVNRAGSVPPVPADLVSGATLNNSAGQMQLQAATDIYYQGFIFATGQLLINNGAGKKIYLRNSQINLTAGGVLNCGSCSRLVLDNTAFNFASAACTILPNAAAIDIEWINTSSAIGGSVPTLLFTPAGSLGNMITLRGVDLSALTTTLYNAINTAWWKILLDSCRIAPGLTRFGTTYASSADEVELVNCFDGTSIISERHTPAGDVTTEFTITLASGAADNVGAFSHKLVSSVRSDKYAMTLDGFWMDVNNTLIGSSRTATVEIVSSASLNNDDVSLLLEYEGTSGSSLASFASSLPATVLTTASAVATSTATWNGTMFTMWNPLDATGAVTVSNNNLTATSASTGQGVRGAAGYGSGKLFFEYTVTTWGNFSTDVGLALSSATLGSLVGAVALEGGSGNIFVNNVSSGVSLGARASGNIISIAVDIGAALIWFRVAPSGNWNNSGTANPATGTGGISISVLAGALYPYFRPNSNLESVTANFGTGAFSSAVPAGFTSGLSVTPVKQKLQVTFTPRVAGRVRAQARLGKPFTTIYVDPQVVIT